MSKPFSIGDEVTWKSQAGGRTTEKSGKVVAVLRKGDGSPISIAGKKFPDHRRMFDSLTIPYGQSEAYFVEVRDGKTTKTKPKLYMPRAKWLKAKN